MLIVAGILGLAFLFLVPSDFRFAKAPKLSPTPIPIEEIITIQEEPVTSEVLSPDGKMKVVMEETKEGESSKYSFSVANTETGETKNIYTRIVLPGVNLELSENAWSPDNKYFFITEKSRDMVNYFVFKESGENFNETEQYIDIVPLFVAKNTGFTMSEITGWDSETLLHLYTVKEDNSRGSSFWFEVPSRAIIQLASR